MHVLRAEKGYIIVGQDTDGSVTPHDLGMGGVVAKKKDFLGKRSLTRARHGAPGPQAARRPAHRRSADRAAGRARSSSPEPIRARPSRCSATSRRAISARARALDRARRREGRPRPDRRAGARAPRRRPGRPGGHHPAGVPRPRERAHEPAGAGTKVVGAGELPRAQGGKPAGRPRRRRASRHRRPGRAASSTSARSSPRSGCAATSATPPSGPPWPRSRAWSRRGGPTAGSPRAGCGCSGSGRTSGCSRPRRSARPAWPGTCAGPWRAGTRR